MNLTHPVPTSEEHIQFAHQANEEVQSTAGAAASACRIMVIDDDEFVLKVMGCMLTDLGYPNFECFDQGAAALAAIDSGVFSPEVLLLDLNMPSMDGIEVLRALGEQKYPGNLILLSGEDQATLRAAEALARAHKLRVVGAQVKPLSREQLTQLLAQHSKRADVTTARLRTRYSSEEVATAIHEGQLVNYYQPKVDAASGRVVGVETLVRWNHPTDGLVGPDQFIPIAEASGLIRELTRTVVMSALTQAKRWQDSGSQLRIAINVSMDDLSSIEFADFLISQSERLQVRPESVMLELTESQLVPNLVAVLDVLTRLRLHRFGLSIDDFGTGHSSLVQLRDLPFDELKIDRSFTHKAWKDQRLHAFFQSSVDLARMLGLSAVAEGVEDAHDLECARSAGCALCQGYFIAKPMPAESIEPWLDEWGVRSKFERFSRSVA